MMSLRRASLAILLATAAGPALAHTGAGATHGFAAGFVHPLLGVDHLGAMVAVGLWAGLVGGRAVWAWPLAFVTTMIAGAMLGLHDVRLPGVEAGIAGSLLLLGLAVAFKAPLPVLAGVSLCGVFALFHGHAHGLEMPVIVSPVPYVAGFSLATALLHGAGVALGIGLARVDRAWLPRLAGGATAVLGVALLIL